MHSIRLIRTFIIFILLCFQTAMACQWDGESLECQFDVSEDREVYLNIGAYSGPINIFINNQLLGIETLTSSRFYTLNRLIKVPEYILQRERGVFYVLIKAPGIKDKEKKLLKPELISFGWSKLSLHDLLPSIFTLTFLLFIFFLREEFSEKGFLSRRIIPLGLVLVVHLFLNSFYLYRGFPQYFNTWLKLHVITTAVTVSMLISLASFIMLNERFRISYITVLLAVIAFFAPSFGHDQEAAFMIMKFLIPIVGISTLFSCFILFKVFYYKHEYSADYVIALIVIGMTTFLLAIYDTYNFTTGNPVEAPYSGVGFLMFYLLCVMVIVIKKKQMKIQNLQLNKALADQAEQVAHDIRSPLAALHMAIKDGMTFDANKFDMMRFAINRIQDIASDLISKDKKVLERIESHETSQVLLSSLLDSIVTEKRVQYRSRSEVELDFQLLKQSYGLFVNINPNIFKRVMSNLIDNSFDSIPRIGKIKLDLNRQGTEVVIRLRDNGTGIPEDKLGSIFEKGVSFKEVGSGLGLFHARKWIETWGGKIEVASTSPDGTEFRITLNSTDAPSWFVNKLQLKRGQYLVIVDDDPSIHQIWKGRLSSSLGSDVELKVVNFTELNLFQEWMFDNQNEEFLVLMDLEFIGDENTGLDAIKEAAIYEKSILITSRFEEDWVREECRRFGIRLVPKDLAGFIPIEFLDGESKKETVILLDDNDLVGQVWSYKAQSANVDLVLFKNEEDFMKRIDTFAKNIRIYVDSDLGEGSRPGEEICKDLHQKGFKNIYMTTGYEADKFEELSFLKDVVDKNAPF